MDIGRDGQRARWLSDEMVSGRGGYRTRCPAGEMDHSSNWADQNENAEHGDDTVEDG
jgi:hypothetical protein